MTKTAIVSLAAKGSELMRELQENHFKNLMTLGLATVGYFLSYPFEIASLRMTAEIDKYRFYSNTRECFIKIRKN